MQWIFQWDFSFSSIAENAELRKKYDELKDEMKKLNQDFELLYRIGGLMASLSRPYEVKYLSCMCILINVTLFLLLPQGLNVTNVQNSCRVLQRKLEQSHELIRSCCEPTRVDITITGRWGCLMFVEVVYLMLYNFWIVAIVMECVIMRYLYLSQREQERIGLENSNLPN